MHNPVSMAVRCGLQYLVCELFDGSWRQWASDLAHKFLEIKLTVFENQVEVVILVYDLFQIYDVRMLDALK
jgi:hypothetical protein